MRGLLSSRFFRHLLQNKTLASEIGFNIRRAGMPGQETQGWHGAFADPDQWGVLTGIPARKNLLCPNMERGA